MFHYIQLCLRGKISSRQESENVEYFGTALHPNICKMSVRSMNLGMRNNLAI